MQETVYLHVLLSGTVCETFNLCLHLLNMLVFWVISLPWLSVLILIVSTSSWLWRWLPLRLSKRQSKSLQTVLLRTTLTRMIIIYVLISSWHLDLDCIIINSASRSSAAIASNSPKGNDAILFYTWFKFALWKYFLNLPLNIQQSFIPFNNPSKKVIFEINS